MSEKSLVFTESDVSRMFDSGKTAIVFPKEFTVELNISYIVAQKIVGNIVQAYGIITLTEMEFIDNEQFIDRTNQHRVSEEQKGNLWPDINEFKFMRFKVEEQFDTPMIAVMADEGRFVNELEFIVTKADMPKTFKSEKGGKEFQKSVSMSILNVTDMRNKSSNANENAENPVSGAQSGNEETVLIGKHMRIKYEAITPIVKIDTEERIVYGIVLEPHVEDAQGDILTPETIRTAAHKFLQDFQVIGVMHEDFTRTKKMKIVESFIVPVDMIIEGENISKGTWMMATKILDDEIWAGAKKGEFTGYSIGGFGQRREIDFNEE